MRSLAPQDPWNGLWGILKGKKRKWRSGPDPQLPPDQTRVYLPDELGVISTKGFTIFKESGESLD